MCVFGHPLIYVMHNISNSETVEKSMVFKTHCTNFLKNVSKKHASFDISLIGILL